MFTWFKKIRKQKINSFRYVFLYEIDGIFSTSSLFMRVCMSVTLYYQSKRQNSTSIFFFFLLLGPLSQPMEVPRPGVKLELQLLAYATVIGDPSHVPLHHNGNSQHWSLLLVFLFSCDVWETFSQKFVSGNSKLFKKSLSSDSYFRSCLIFVYHLQSEPTQRFVTQVLEPVTVPTTWHFYFFLYLCLSLQKGFCFCFFPGTVCSIRLGMD